MGLSEHVNPRGRVHEDEGGLRDATVAAGGTHVALLARTTVDDWHRSLGTTAPGRCHYVSVDDTVRSATAASGGGRRVADGVYVSVLERPVTDPTTVLEEAFAGAPRGTLVVDDPTFLVEDTDDADAALTALETAASEAGAALHVGLPTDEEAAVAVTRRFAPADEATALTAADRSLRYLRAADPTNFGYLRQHWREARNGLEAVDMSYPQAKQVHATLPAPETTPRTLGAALGALVELGALGLWGDTVAANRYDLTAYDPERVAAIGEALESMDG